MYYKKMLLPCIFIVSFVFTANAQSISQYIQKADSFYLKKNYSESIKIYKRVLYFSGENHLYEKIADSYFLNQDYRLANNYFDSAIFLKTDSNKSLLILKKIDCQIFLQEYEPALKCLNRMDPSENKEIQSAINFYKAILHFSMCDYELAESMFISSLSDTAENSKDKIKAIFKKKHLLHKPSPQTASLLSIIAPGTGQWYAGQIKSGINSTVLLGILVLIALDMGSRYTFIDPIISVAPWFIRYYNGGILNAKNFAVEKQNLNHTQILNKILEIIDTANESNH
jgi:tetratricopeptide (TPR) repeat protein